MDAGGCRIEGVPDAVSDFPTHRSDSALEEIQALHLAGAVCSP